MVYSAEATTCLRWKRSRSAAGADGVGDLGERLLEVGAQPVGAHDVLERLEPLGAHHDPHATAKVARAGLDPEIVAPLVLELAQIHHQSLDERWQLAELIDPPLDLKGVERAGRSVAVGALERDQSSLALRARDGPHVAFARDVADDEIDGFEPRRVALRLGRRAGFWLGIVGHAGLTKG